MNEGKKETDERRKISLKMSVDLPILWVYQLKFHVIIYIVASVGNILYQKCDRNL